MLSINAVSLAPDVNDWLANSRQPRVLHVFDHVCNLINEQREVLSIVTQQIGNGPFNLVIPRFRKSFERIPDLGASRQTSEVFSDHLNAQSPISIRANQLNLGDLTINTVNAKLWFPRPDWGMLHAGKDDILKQISSLRATLSEVEGKRSNLRHRDGIASGRVSTRSVSTTALAMTGIPNYQLPTTQSLISNSLVSSLANADLPSSLTAAQQLAGLGIGLTPAGDDFLLGAIYAAWIIHSAEVAKVLAEGIANIAAPLTTSLSAAWLKSAGKGEAGILWHHFFDALISADTVRIQEAMDNILAVGETSGADALSGFIGTLVCWAGLASSKIP